MESIVINYYYALLARQNPSREAILKVTNLISPMMDPTLKNRLDIPFSREEIKKALFDLNPGKASRPDGFTALFFQNAWDLIEEEISTNALNFLNNSSSIHEWNETVVTLIPKTKEPSSLKDFRPIILGNVTYKIIACAITNRFKEVLGNIIDPLQSAFIPGRAITNNIIIGYECMNWLRNSRNK